MEAIRVTSPLDGRLLAELPEQGPDEVAAAFARARRAQPAWADLGSAGRARALRHLARVLRDDTELRDTLVAESGKVVYEAEAIEIFYMLEQTRYVTSRASRRALADDLRRPFVFLNKRARVVRHPRGVVGVIGPWNWPLLCSYADCLAPLAAGNAVVLKPSEWTPLTSLRVAALWKREGLPGEVLQVVTGRGAAGAAMVEHADMVFFTGSERVGRQVAGRCGQRLVPCVCELGGVSPMLVCADADLPRAARAAVWSGFAHAGQICIRTERVFVERAVAERFTTLCIEEIGRLRQGPPRGAGATTDIGAITFGPQITRAEEHIADAVARGAKVAVGGHRRTDVPGRWFEPTLLVGATAEMRIMREETFGPVLPIMAIDSVEDGLTLANGLPYGLSGSVWSGDRAKASALARRLEAGSVCVNDVLMNYFVVEAPLGGIKASGIGFRHGPEALLQFVRTETIVEDQPVLGRLLSGLLARHLYFPYRDRTLRLLRAFMQWMYGRRSSTARGSPPR